MTCPVCKKTFSSRKAMHGHLRTHPERNYRGTNPNSSAKPSKTKAPAAGDGSRQPVVMISTNFLVPTAERERLQSMKILKRSMIKEETKIVTEDGGCSTSIGAAAPSRKYEHRRRRMSFSSYQASGGHVSTHSRIGVSIIDGANKISPLMAKAAEEEVPMLSEKEWIGVDALKLLRESTVSTPTLAATHPPLTFDLNQPPSPPPAPADQRKKTN